MVNSGELTAENIGAIMQQTNGVNDIQSTSGGNGSISDCIANIQEEIINIMSGNVGQLSDGNTAELTLQYSTDPGHPNQLITQSGNTGASMVVSQGGYDNSVFNISVSVQIFLFYF